ncbi:MAG: mechanosensitive ion channel family protein [Spirochaetales bacterium]|nr:mechanosensitive ion channel family protein [Spirochaetales bacterium]
MGQTVTALAEGWFLALGLSDRPATVLARVAIVIVIVGLSLLSNFLAKKIISTVVRRIVRKSRSRWDDIIYDRGVLNRLSHIAPALVVYFMNPLAFPEIGWVTTAIQRGSIAYMIAMAVLVLDAVLESVNDIYMTNAQQSRQRPIKGYIQLLKILFYIVGLVLVVTTIMDKSPVGILSGIGALSAVLLLVFRDTILGLVAGVQLSSNHMVHIGDWIEMPKYGADGDVIDVTLQTVKVQNWDKTITTIPIYSLVSDSFKNWRGMSESGGRRIKRAINIDMRTVKFCTPEMTDRLKRYPLIRDYVTQRQAEVSAYNAERGLDDADLLSSRRMTNLGTFRAYIAAYLRAHPMINKEMTFLIRHLSPGPTGLPIEIYVFSADKVWANYEGIQADIFDHLLAVIPEFELQVFQQPSGSDIERLVEKSGQ